MNTDMRIEAYQRHSDQLIRENKQLKLALWGVSLVILFFLIAASAQ